LFGTILGVNDYGWKAGIPIEEVEIISKPSRWPENRTSIADIDTSESRDSEAMRGQRRQRPLNKKAELPVIRNGTFALLMRYFSLHPLP
jgi:hypothetical protein